MSEQQTLTAAADLSMATRCCAGSFPGRRDQIRLIRGILSAFFDDCPAADDAVLIVSELAANAVTHSASGQPGGLLIIRAETSPATCVRAEVEDQGSTWDGDLSTAQPPHGLFILRALSADSGTRRGQDGWITWFTIPIASGQEPPA
jgi:two-component sensor histidine kinase